MKSAFAITEEIDMRDAADELIAGIKAKLEFGKNACGLLYYDYEMDGDTLSAYLHEELGIDILGCSTIATLDNENGYRDMSALLTVFTADDCEFHFGITEALTNENAKQKINVTFLETQAKAKVKPQLAFVFFPCGTDIVFDKHINDLSEMSDHVAIIGGIPSSSSTTEKSIVFNGNYYLKMAAMLLITGNVHPLISLANVISTISDRKDDITKAEGTCIREVNGKPFADYLESFGINLQESVTNAGQIFFQKYPLLIENQNANFNSEIPYVRILDHIDENGSGVAYSGIPEGGKVCLAILRREDIAATVEKGLKDLFAKIEASDREYSTIICITCAARHVTLNPYYDDEGNAIQQIVPSSYSFSGFYSYGELCPIAIEEGKANNQLHNASIVFCAM